MMERSKGGKVAAILRTGMVAVVIAAEVLLLVFVAKWLQDRSGLVYYGLIAVSVVCVLYLASQQDDAAYKTMWMLVVMFLPGVGLLLYLVWGRAPLGARERHFVNRAFEHMERHMPTDGAALRRLEDKCPPRARLARYLSRQRQPIYQNTTTTYYPLGELFFDGLVADLEKAERFIFMEYFIIEYGKVWDRIYEVLKRKAAQGVQVRLMYDDAGCLFTLNPDFKKQLEDAGIQVGVFGKVHRYLSDLYLNYRNHQKIAVIDGNIAHVGGNNIADAYANVYPKHGHWKDTNVRLEGDAVWSLTCTFLGMWDLAHHTAKEDYERYRPTVRVKSESFCQPLHDGPGNNPLNPIEDTYRQIIATAKDHCYITTPYLVIDSGMFDVLRMAVRSGVDVRIYTPKIYDHWYVHLVTRSFYGELLAHGVRIFEYTPGFIHAKMVTSDDDVALIGSVNMDYRSFYLHYENTVLFVDDPIVQQVRQDILAVQAVSEEITYELWRARPWHSKLTGAVLKLFATLM